MRDRLPRDNKGRRIERTGKRHLGYSDWHRKMLSRGCYATDIDFVEYREVDGEIVPVAIVEIKSPHVRDPKYLCSPNHRIMQMMAEGLGIKFFIVLTDPSEDIKHEDREFWVWEVKEAEDFNKYRKAYNKYGDKAVDMFFHKYTSEEYAQVLENL